MKLSITKATEKPIMPVAKTMMTTSPEMVRWLSFFMQTGSPAAFVEHKLPAAQVPIAVIVGVQPSVFPFDTEQTDVETMFVVEQRSEPVVIADEEELLVVLDVLDAVELSLVVDEAVVAVMEAVEEAAADEAEDSDVVVASVLEGAVVEAAAAADFVVSSVDFAVFLAAFFSVVAAGVADESTLFLSSRPTSGNSYPLHSYTNREAPTVASASEQPPVTKHCSISLNFSKLILPPRHFEIRLLSPQEFQPPTSSK